MRFTVAVVLIVLLAAGLRLSRLTEPWNAAHKGWNGAHVADFARNFLTFGYDAPWCTMIENDIAYTQTGLPAYYGHPPLVPVLYSFVYRLIGVSEWSTRILPALLSFGSVGLLASIAASLWDRRTALVTAALAATIPLLAYYGDMADFLGPIFLFFYLLTIAAYLRWLQRPSVVRMVVVCVAFGACALSDWYGYYLPAIVAFHYLLAGRRVAPWRPFILLVVTAALLLGITLWHLDNVDALDALAHRAAFRASGQAGHADGTAAGEQADSTAITVARYGWRTLTPPVFALGGVGFMLVILRFFRRASHSSDTLVQALFLAGLGHLIIFRNAAIEHDFFWIPMAPCFVLAAGRLLASGSEWVGRRIPKGEPIGMAVVIAVVLLGGVQTVRSIDRNPPALESKQLGEAMAQVATAGESILGIGRHAIDWQAKFYADRTVIYIDETCEPGDLVRQIERLGRLGGVALVLKLEREENEPIRYLSSRGQPLSPEIVLEIRSRCLKTPVFANDRAMLLRLNNPGGTRLRLAKGAGSRIEWRFESNPHRTENTNR